MKNSIAILKKKKKEGKKKKQVPEVFDADDEDAGTPYPHMDASDSFAVFM